jgi:hypothetical protein
LALTLNWTLSYQSAPRFISSWTPRRSYNVFALSHHRLFDAADSNSNLERLEKEFRCCQ